MPEAGTSVLLLLRAVPFKILMRNPWRNTFGNINAPCWPRMNMQIDCTRAQNILQALSVS